MPSRLDAKNRLYADEVAALSLALRHRSAQIKASDAPPEQYKVRLLAGQTELIPEPWGEPGGKSEKLDEKTGKPKKYQLIKVIALDNLTALHSANLALANRLAHQHLKYGVAYSNQRDVPLMKVVTDFLAEQPIFECYDNHWPVRAYIKSVLRSQHNQERIINKKVKEQETVVDQQTLNADPGAGDNAVPPAEPPAAVVPPAVPTVPAPIPPIAPTATPHQDTETANEPNHSETHSAPDLTPPASPLPYRKRNRGDIDHNVPGVKNPRAKKLKANNTPLSTVAHASKPAKSGRTRSGGASSAATNSVAGPGPNTIAQKKKGKKQN